ncbi:YgjV family protein [Variovorax sp. LjRoot84]|uniref:YgjV family protein n=1 Tax=Variovorax sp. LjRoot84 TaxID=3342340 RepID=UPI003F5184E1
MPTPAGRSTPRRTRCRDSRPVVTRCLLSPRGRTNRRLPRDAPVAIGRQASAEVVQSRSSRTRLLAFLFIVAISLVASALTWEGWTSVYTAAGSLVGTWAMFYLRGTALRLAMVLVAAL